MTRGIAVKMAFPEGNVAVHGYFPVESYRFDMNRPVGDAQAGPDLGFRIRRDA
jgi:hypothetical protein